MIECELWVAKFAERTHIICSLVSFRAVTKISEPAPDVHSFVIGAERPKTDRQVISGQRIAAERDGQARGRQLRRPYFEVRESLDCSRALIRARNLPIS